MAGKKNGKVGMSMGHVTPSSRYIHRLLLWYPSSKERKNFNGHTVEILLPRRGISHWNHIDECAP